jgi:hypothetical protein
MPTFPVEYFDCCEHCEHDAHYQGKHEHEEPCAEGCNDQPT